MAEHERFEYLGLMASEGTERSGFALMMLGKPRIWVGVLWCCLGLAWLLLALFDGPTVTRILLGAAWLILGLSVGSAALRDRKHGRGFYRMTQPRPVADDESQHK